MEFITTSLPYEGAMTSFIGGRKENQDTVGYSDTARGLLLVVCDGMGGGPGGKTASFIATNAIIAYVRNGKPAPHLVEKLLGINYTEESAAPAPQPIAAPVPPAPAVPAPVATTDDIPTPNVDAPMPTVDTPNLPEGASAVAFAEATPQEKKDDNATVLHDAVVYANDCLNEAVKLRPMLRGMGTTTTCVLIDKDCAVLAHVGDSRIYQLRGNSMVFRTADHSFVGQLVRDGKLTEEQARLSAKSNIITRAIGAAPDIEVDIDIRPYEKGDRFVLCTDGVWGSMPQPQLIKEMAQKVQLGGVLDSLNSQVESIGQSKGGHHDNFSMIIIDTKTNSILKEEMSKKIKICGIALAAICAISIIMNIVLFATRKPAVGADEIKALSERVDSLSNANKMLTDDIAKLSADNDTLKAKAAQAADLLR